MTQLNEKLDFFKFILAKSWPCLCLDPPKVLYKSTRLLKIINYCNFLFKNITVRYSICALSIDLQFLRNLRLRLTDFIFSCAICDCAFWILFFLAQYARF